ncbi:peptidyl-Lys metalloendopeptidase [Ceratobasidium sp. AG-Ba]|nr:peptidyl-Lys metalloendopeptidase [Ceratobasidium sp. AG-Ba]
MIALSLLFLATVAAASPKILLEVSGPSNPVDIYDLVVKTTVTNVGSQTLKLLNKPGTVLSPLDGTNAFEISSAAGVPAFTGISVKWSPDLALGTNEGSQFTILTPGQSIKRLHSLAGVYNFSTSGEGWYTVSDIAAESGPIYLICPHITKMAPHPSSTQEPIETIELIETDSATLSINERSTMLDQTSGYSAAWAHHLLIWQRT